MILLDYIQQLDGYKGKRDRIQYALTQIVAGYPQDVLNQDLIRLEDIIRDIEQLRVEPLPIIVRLVADMYVNVPIGNFTKLNVEYTLADGTLVTDPVYKRATALFRDFDKLYNNNGFITSLNVVEYTGEDATFTLSKTVNGFDVFDSKLTQGLHVVAVEDEFVIVDINGESIGFTFTTDGKELVGDNWTIRVANVTDGTTFEVENEAIATVEDGVVYGVEKGITFITVRNGDLVYPITVNVTNAGAVPDPGEGEGEPTPEPTPPDEGEPTPDPGEGEGEGEPTPDPGEGEPTPDPGEGEDDDDTPTPTPADATAPALRAATITDGTFDADTNAFRVAKDATVTEIVIEFDEAVVVADEVKIEVLVEGEADYVVAGSIAVTDNLISITFDDTALLAAVEGTHLLRFTGDVTDAVGNVFEGTLPSVVVAA